MVNQEGNVTECSIANIALEQYSTSGASYWITPPIEDGSFLISFP